MLSINEAVERVLDYLANRTSLESLEDWSADASWDAHKNADIEAQKLVYEIRGILNDHEEDESEESLRKDLVAAIYPFQVIEIHVGPSPLQEAQSYAGNARLESPAAA